jgi:hypothetical protein
VALQVARTWEDLTESTVVTVVAEAPVATIHIVGLEVEEVAVI